MKTGFLKTLLATLAVLVAAGLLSSGPAPASAAGAQFDAATAYKDAKCAMCHKANAEKFFDPAKTDDQLVQAIVKGVKGEKPPVMPAYEAKGVTEEQAKALVAYMRSLRQTPA